MEKITVKCPAKINLSLKVGKVRPDGFHPIESVMQAISLYDYVTLSQKLGMGTIEINGTSDEIPYDERNIAYKAAHEFLQKTNLKLDINIYIEKNIPVCAGLAGGSTDAAGVLFALNKLNNEILSKEDMFKICAKLGSDLNFCLIGSKQMCSGKGDDMHPLPFEDFSLSLIKPKKLSISAKEAYAKFDELKIQSNMPNDLEFALLPHYTELQHLHSLGYQMSGSGPTYFVLKHELKEKLGEDYMIIENLHAINHGICEK